MKRAALIVPTPESTRREAKSFHPTVETIYKMSVMGFSVEKIADTLKIPVQSVLSKLHIVENRMLTLAAESLDKQVGKMLAQTDVVMEHSYDQYLINPDPSHLVIILKAVDMQAKHLALAKRVEGKTGKSAGTIQSLLQEIADRNDSDLTALWSTNKEQQNEDE